MPETLHFQFQHLFSLVLLLFDIPQFCWCGRDQTADIFRNDQARYRNNPIWWKAYFAEIMAACFVIIVVVLCLCWIHCTGGVNSVGSDGPSQSRRYSKYTINTINPDPEPLGFNVVVTTPSNRKPSLAKCSKPSCVCAPGGEGGSGGGGKPSWKTWKRTKELENEVYLPPSRQ